MAEGALAIRTDKDFDLKVWLTLYNDCNFYRDGTVDDLAAVIDHAWLIVTGWLGGDMVGSVSVLSDGCNYAEFDDVVVHPKHQRQGIGTALMRTALDRLIPLNRAVIKLNAIPGVEPFYEQLGFGRKNETPMEFRRTQEFG